MNSSDCQQVSGVNADHGCQIVSTDDLYTHNHQPPVLMTFHAERSVEDLQGWEDSPLTGDKLSQCSSSLALGLSSEDYVYSDPETVDREAFWMRYGIEVEEATDKRRLLGVDVS